MSEEQRVGVQSASKPSKFSPAMVAGLDAARGLTALYVVLHHLMTFWNIKGPLSYPLRFGQEAVIAFFLLSGFLIFAHEHARGDGVMRYYGRRVRRIYPTLIVAMIMSTIVAASMNELGARFSWVELFGNLAGLQDSSSYKPGVLVEPYLGNTPLWSLSYEIFFYLIFPGVIVMWRRSPVLTTHLIGLTACLAYVWYAASPNHLGKVLAYFLVWWAGAMAANAYLAGKRDLRGLVAPLVWLGALIAVAAVVTAKNFAGIGYYPFLQLRHFLAALVIIIIGFGPLGALFARTSLRVAGPAAWLASISYGLYLFHFPLFISGLMETVGGSLLALTLLVALSWLADAKLSQLLQRAFRNSRPAKATLTVENPSQAVRTP